MEIDRIYAQDQDLIEEFHRVENEMKEIQEPDIQTDEETERPQRVGTTGSLIDTCLVNRTVSKHFEDLKTLITSEAKRDSGFPKSLVRFIFNPKTKYLDDVILSIMKQKIRNRTRQYGIRFDDRMAICVLQHSFELENVCDNVDECVRFIPTGAMLANGHFQYNAILINNKTKKWIPVNRGYTSWYWLCEGVLENKLIFRFPFYHLMNYCYAMNLATAGLITDHVELLEYTIRIYTGSNASDHMQHMDSVKQNCNPRCQLALTSGNNASRKSSCYRHGCECHSSFLCISVCGCEKCYADVSIEKRMTLSERKALDKQTFDEEKLTLRQLTNTDYDDALEAWKRSDKCLEQEQDEVSRDQDTSNRTGDQRELVDIEFRVKKRESEQEAISCSKRKKGSRSNRSGIYTEEEFLEVHQDFCAECGQDGFERDLFLCHTCNLGWHKECIKDDMSDDRWQCNVCIEKGLSPDDIVVIP